MTFVAYCAFQAFELDFVTFFEPVGRADQDEIALRSLYNWCNHHLLANHLDHACVFKHDADHV